jgi:NB-ARC domain
MTINPSDLQAVIDRLEAGEDLSEPDLQLLATALRSRQITIATGEGAIGIGASADGATLVTGNGNIFINGANAESILNLLQERGLPDAPRVAPLPRVRLPDNFVPRPDALNVVKAKLLGAEDKTLVVSAIAGLGGLGKSVLATAIVLDPEVQARFTDGILWVTLGQNPDLLSLLGDWIRELDKSREAFSANTLEAAARYLGTLLAERRMLLVVDDVWNAAHAEWFRVGGIGCRVLVTTREARLEGAEYHELDLMTEDEAIELVRQKLGQRWQLEQEAEVRAFANLLGRLPLALDLAHIPLVRSAKK